MEPKHTPGPWTVHEDPENPGSCTIYPEHGHPIGEEGAYFAPADARLIAAAPDLLEALLRMLAPFDGMCLCGHFESCPICSRTSSEREAERMARAAIAKARGTT